MEKRMLARTGLVVSRIGLGGIKLGRIDQDVIGDLVFRTCSRRPTGG